MKREAFKRIGYLYPKVKDERGKEHTGGMAPPPAKGSSRAGGLPPVDFMISAFAKMNEGKNIQLLLGFGQGR